MAKASDTYHSIDSANLDGYGDDVAVLRLTTSGGHIRAIPLTRTELFAIARQALEALRRAED